MTPIPHNNIPSNDRTGLLLLLAILVLFTNLPANATLRTWNGGGADSNWSTANNWGGTAPATNNVDGLVFSGSTKQNNTNNFVATTNTSITFATGGWTLYGNAVAMGGPFTNTTGNNIINNNIALTATRTAYFSAGQLTLNGTVSGAFGLATGGSGTGLLVLSGANTYTGGTTINSGTANLSITRSNALGTGAVSIPKGGTTSSGYLQLNLAGTNVITNTFSGFASTTGGSTAVPDIDNVAGTNTLTSALTVTSSGGNGVTVQSDAGLLTLAGQISTTVDQNRYVQLYGSGNGMVNGIIGVAAGSLAATTNNFGVVKWGSGTWTLNATNVYAGQTTINAGTVALGANGSITNSSVVNITSGAIFDVSAVPGGWVLGGGKTLTGGGGVNGSVVTAASGTPVITPGTSTTQGVLAISNNLTLNGNVNLNMNLSFDPTGTVSPSDLIAVSGNLTASGTNTFVLGNYLGGLLTNATYPLIKFGGTFTGDATNFAVTGFSNPGQAGYIIATTTNISLVVTGALPSILSWKGNDSVNPTSWDIATSTNWMNGSAPSFFTNFDLVTFNDTASNYTVNIQSTVTPGALTVNATNNYTFSGADISGVTGLTKSGSGTLTLSANNTYTGITTFGGGSIAVATIGAGGAASPLGAAPNNTANLVLNGGTLEYTGGGESSARDFSIGANGGTVMVDTAGVTLTFTTSGGWVSGGNKLTKTGPGTLAFSSQQVLTGTNFVRGGILQLNPGTGSAFGTDVTSPVNISGGALDINGQSLSTKPIVVAGMGDLNIDGNTNGAIINTGSAQTSALTSVTMTNDAAFGGTSRWDIRANPTATLSTGGNAYNLYKVGANQVSLASATVDAALASVDVRAGTLSLQLNTTGLGNPAGTLTVRNGATFDLFAATNKLNKQIVLNDGATFNASSGSNTVAGPISLTGDLGGGPTFNVASNVSLTLTGLISGPGNPTLSGGGTLTLSATNSSFSGYVTVSGGKLVLNSAITNASSLTINDGAAVGVIVTGTNELSPSTLTLGNGAGPTTVEFTGVTNTAVAPVNTATLYVNGPTTVNVTSGIFYAGQTYPLIAFGSLAGSGGFTTGALPSGVFGTVITNGSAIALSVSAVYALDVWTAAASTNWDIGTTTNWTSYGLPAAFANNNYAQFDDTASNANVLVTTTVSPTAITVNNTLKDYTISGSPIGGGSTLTKQGTGALTLSGANTYSGGTTLSAGTLNINHATALGAAAGAFTITGGTIDNTSGGAITLANNHAQNWNGDFAFAGSQNLNLGTGAVTLSTNRQVAVNNNTLTVGGAIGDGGSGLNLSKFGAGTLTLTGAKNWTGNTLLYGGTLRITNTPLPATTAAFGGVSNSATLDITGLAQTFAGMTFGNQSNVTATVTILGDSTTSLTSSPTNLTIAPINSAGKLTVTMASLSSYTYSNVNGTFSVNLNANSGSGGNATVTLAGGSDTIIATNIQVGNVGSGNSGASAPSTLALGTNATLNANTISIGNSGSRASGSLIAGSGTLTVRGTGGGNSAANLTVGRSDSFTSSDNTTSTFDSSAGTLNALFGSILMGQDNAGSASARGITIRGNLNMGAGTLIASNLTLGNLAGSYAGGTYSITSTLNLSNAGTAIITNILFADNAASSSPAALTMSGLININGGASLYATNLQQGNIAGITTLNTKVNWTNGTIGNISGSDLSVSGVSLVLGGSSTFNIDATSAGSAVNSLISGPGALAKTGNGTLWLSGAETYTGNTAINGGTLALTNAASLVSTNLTIAGSATFDVAGLTATPLVLAPLQSIGNSTSTAFVNGGVDASSGKLALAYASGTPALSIKNGALTLASGTTVTVNNTGAALGNGSYKIVSAGTGGSVAGTAPAPVSVTGAGLGNGGTASLAITGSELYLNVSGVSSVNTNPPVLTNSVSGSTLTLSWPADHLGWRLLVQTNSLSTGLGSTWYTWPNSTNLTSVSVTVNPANPTVFFRLVYP